MTEIESFDFASLDKLLKDTSAELATNENLSDLRGFISTGSIVFDTYLAKGICRGGYPIGRFVELFGPEGSGKCLALDNYVFTGSGWKTLTEMFESVGLEPSTTNREHDVSFKDCALVNRYGSVEKVNTVTTNGRRKVFEVKTRTGSKVRATAHHPFLVMSKTGNWVWRKLDELTTSDYIVSKRLTDTFGTVSIGKDEAYVLGVLVADGFLGDGRISVTNDDPTVRGYLIETLSKMLGKDPNIYQVSNSVDMHWNTKEGIAAFYATYGMGSCLAATKVIPPVVRSLGKEELASFLRGYFDCECHATTEDLEVSSASSRLLDELKLLLLQFGVVSTVGKHQSTYVKKDETVAHYSRLMISGNSYDLYLREIGFTSENRKKSVKGHTDTAFSGLDTIPNVSDLLRDMYDASETTREHSSQISDYMHGHHLPSTRKLREILSLPWEDCYPVKRLREIAEADYFYDAVELVTYVDELPTFDFELPDTHSFIVNGLVTHNTTLLTHAMVSAQKGRGTMLTWEADTLDGVLILRPKVTAINLRKGLAVLIDSEYKFPMDRAQTLGLNPQQLVRIVPEKDKEGNVIPISFEKAIIEIEAVLARVKEQPYFQQPDVPVVIGWDSLASSPTNSELEGEGLKDGIAYKARGVRGMMRKLVGHMAALNVTVLVINQVYDRIGVPGTEASGGRGLKYNSSIRLKVKRESDYVVSAEKVGIMVQAANVKSSFCPPFQLSIPVRFTSGIDDDAALLDYFINLSPKVYPQNPIKKNAAWLKLTVPGLAEPVAFQGSSWKTVLAETPGAREHVLNCLMESCRASQPT